MVGDSFNASPAKAPVLNNVTVSRTRDLMVPLLENGTINAWGGTDRNQFKAAALCCSAEVPEREGARSERSGRFSALFLC